jgi:hypothetical protein
MKRSGFKPRTERMPRGKAIRTRNPERRAKELDRTHGDPDFRAWIKRRPCVVCGRTPCDAAHLKSGGTGRKDDVSGTVPLCSTIGSYVGHHDEYDGRAFAGGKQTFAANYPHLDLWALAAATQRAYEAERNTQTTPEESDGTAKRGRDASVEASRGDDESRLGTRGARGAQGGSGARPSADLSAARQRKRGLTPLSAIVPGVVAKILEGGE